MRRSKRFVLEVETLELADGLRPPFITNFTSLAQVTSAT